MVNLLSRKRLVTLFNLCKPKKTDPKTDSKKLILVTAGAGYGKTTLVADALSKTQTDTIWYRLDPQDMDFMVFMSYLQAGFFQKHPEVNKSFGKYRLKKSTLKNQDDLLLQFIKGLETKLVKKTALVLDDYHLVQDSTGINRAIEFILERIPQNLQIIIISRREPPLRISKIQVMGQVLEIGEKEIAFTSSEIHDFYSNIKELPISEEHTRDIYEKTGGWAASLVLFSHALKNKNPREIGQRLVQFCGSQKYIFSYLEENVFETQSDEIQDFMLKICLLSAIDSMVCNRIFHIDNAKEILNQMIKDHLLIFPVHENPNIFYLHHLFRDFLIEKLEQKYSPARIKELHQRIAHYMEQDMEQGDIFQALHHYIEAENFDAVVRLITTNEMKFLLEGKIYFLKKCLKKIPPSFIEKKPQLLFAEARLYSYFGNPGDAIFKLKAAHKLFKKDQSSEDMAKCLIEIGSQYYYTGHVKEAKLLMEQVLIEVDESSTTYAIAMTYLIFLSSALGEFDKASQYTRQAREVISEYPNFERQVSTALIHTSCSYQHYISGEFNQSQVLNKKILKIGMELDIESILPLVYYQYSAASFFLEQFDQGIDFAKKGLCLCEKIGLQDSKKGWLYLAFAQNSTGLGRFEEGINLVNQAIEIFETPGNRWALANAWDCLNHIYLGQHKPELAKKMVIQAMDIIDGDGLTITEGILGNSMANLLLGEKKFNAALDHLKSSAPKIKDARFHLFENHLLTARSYLGLELPQNAVTHLLSAFKISRESNFSRFVEREKEWIASLLDSPLVTNTSKQKIQEGSSIFKQAPPALTLCLLGRFRLRVGGKKINSSQWKSSKALLILKYLASNTGAGFIPREVLIEILWPDEDILKTGKRFNVAMSALRKVLEPDIAPRAPSSYIIRKKESYRLRNKGIQIDVEQFLKELQKAEKQNAEKPKTEKSTANKPTITDKTSPLTHYLAAEVWYTGSFLEEDPYEQWCMEKREHLNSRYLQALTSILRFYETKNELEACVTYAKKILKADPYDEEVVRKLMVFYASLKNQAKVKETYANFKERVQAIDCPITSDTKLLFKHLIRHSNPF